MAELDGRFIAPPYRLVAHNAATEATVIGGQRDHCPTMAATPLLCTVKLARIAVPELSSHKLNALLRYFAIPKPADRHRALPDVEVTLQVFRALLATGRKYGKWSTLRDLDTAANVHVKPGQRADNGAEQDALF